MWGPYRHIVCGTRADSGRRGAWHCTAGAVGTTSCACRGVGRGSRESPSSATTVTTAECVCMWRQHPSNTRTHCTFETRGLEQTYIPKQKQHASSLARHDIHTVRHGPRRTMKWRDCERSQHHAHTQRQQRRQNTKSTLKIDEGRTPEHAARPSATRTPCELCWKRSIVLNFRPLKAYSLFFYGMYCGVFRSPRAVMSVQDQYLISRTRVAVTCGRWRRWG